jgi:hypothetical protein
MTHRCTPKVDRAQRIPTRRHPQPGQPNDWAFRLPGPSVSEALVSCNAELGGARYNSHMEREDLSQRLSSGVDELWWRYRFLQDVANESEADSADLDLAVECFVRLAVVDPTWAKRSLSDRGPAGHQLGRLLDIDRAHRAVEGIRLTSTREEALVRASVLIASVRWSARRGEPQHVEVWQEAWQELLRVPEGDRDEEWSGLAIQPCARVAYDQYRQLAVAHMATLQPFGLSHFLPDALAVAFRNRDWPAFEDWSRRFRGLPEALRHGHGAASVINLEGLRALSEGRPNDAEAAMRDLLAVADGLTFLSNDDVSSLPKSLREAGVCLDLCQAFDQLVERRDWRNLTE